MENTLDIYEINHLPPLPNMKVRVFLTRLSDKLQGFLGWKFREVRELSKTVATKNFILTLSYVSALALTNKILHNLCHHLTATVVSPIGKIISAMPLYMHLFLQIWVWQLSLWLTLWKILKKLFIFSSFKLFYCKNRNGDFQYFTCQQQSKKWLKFLFKTELLFFNIKESLMFQKCSVNESLLSICFCK